MNVPQATGIDYPNFADMVGEGEGLFEEPIIIRKAAAVQPSTPGAFGTQQKLTFAEISATACVVEMSVAANMFAAGTLSAGDLVLEMRERLNEGNENLGGSQLADRVVYRGMEYRLVQRPIPAAFAPGRSPDAQFYVVHLRRTNATTDVVGG